MKRSPFQKESTYDFAESLASHPSRLNVQQFVKSTSVPPGYCLGAATHARKSKELVLPPLTSQGSCLGTSTGSPDNLFPSVRRAKVPNVRALLSLKALDREASVATALPLRTASKTTQRRLVPVETANACQLRLLSRTTLRAETPAVDTGAFASQNPWEHDFGACSRSRTATGTGLGGFQGVDSALQLSSPDSLVPPPSVVEEPFVPAASPLSSKGIMPAASISRSAPCTSQLPSVGTWHKKLTCRNRIAASDSASPAVTSLLEGPWAPRATAWPGYFKLQRDAKLEEVKARLHETREKWAGRV